MSRVAFPLVLQSPVTGSALVGAKATVTKHVVGGALGSGGAAEIFEEETGAKKVAGNVIVTDNTGRWTQGSGAAYAQYWIPEGRYDIIISGAGLTAVTITRELVTSELVVQEGGIGNEAVGTSKLRMLAVTAGQLALEAVEAGAIKALAVTTAKLAEGAVTTAKLAEGTIRKPTLTEPLTARAGSTVFTPSATRPVMVTITMQAELSLFVEGSNVIAGINTGSYTFWLVPGGTWEYTTAKAAEVKSTYWLF
jgi:hypothetical protein